MIILGLGSNLSSKYGDRFKNIELALSLLESNNIKICGMENPGFGNYLNIVSDDELNRLYNSSKYVLLPSKNEGIGLSMIEGMICGAIPITCSDNLTAKEFSPSDFICEPNSKSIIISGLLVSQISSAFKSKDKKSIKMSNIFFTYIALY